MNPGNLPLRDIHLPAEISWWPPAPGWWALLLTVLLLVATIYGLNRYTRRRRFRRLALAQLEELERQYHDQADPQQLMQSLSCLLRQSALLHFPQSHCAGLVGEAWLTFLDQQIEGKQFSQGIGTLLIKDPYLPQVEVFDAKELLDLCRNWLHRLPPVPKPKRGHG